MQLAVMGLAAGAAAAALLAGTLRSMLFDVTPLDPLVLAATAAAVLLVSAVASLVPACRVMRVDPAVALGTE